MAFQEEPVAIGPGTTTCSGCGARLDPKRRAFHVTGLPLILRTTYGDFTFDRMECVRERARKEYLELGQLKSLNRSRWDAHGPTNEERMLSLRALYTWADSRR